MVNHQHNMAYLGYCPMDQILMNQQILDQVLRPRKLTLVPSFEGSVCRS